jgi:hypothetical protein
MVVDPTDSEVLYTVAGYGQGRIYKSTNGGVDWTSTPMSKAIEESPAAYLDYDAAHHLLYSSNLDGGFWRFVTQ